MKRYTIIKNVKIPEWLCRNGTTDTLLNAREKTAIRKHIAIRTKKWESYMGLFGEGEDFHLIRKINPEAKIRMIDDGRGFKNKHKLKEIAKETPELLITNYKQFAKNGKETFAIIWLDFCGQMSHQLLEHIRLTPRIMQGKGELYITIMEKRDSIFPEWMTREQKREQTTKLIIDEFKERGVSLKTIYQKRYNSIPMHPDRKTLIATPMWTIGFAYSKI